MLTKGKQETGATCQYQTIVQAHNIQRTTHWREKTSNDAQVAMPRETYSRDKREKNYSRRTYNRC